MKQHPRWNATDLAVRIRQWITDHPDALEITVPSMQRVLGGDLEWGGHDARYLPPHFVEQAFQILNLSGELSHAGPRSSPCACGDHRAARYTIRRRS